jgi:hypothetical protein
MNSDFSRVSVTYDDDDDDDDDDDQSLPVSHCPYAI